MAQRPTVSVIVPFAGTPRALDALVGRLSGLALAPGDELIIADNRAGAEATPRELPARVRLHPASAVASPGFARNRGAAAAQGEWLVFIDADTDPDPDLLDAYFAPPPAPRTTVLAGAILDVPGAEPASFVSRHAVALLRSALVAAGGFDEHARAGEDADLCFRLAAMGFEIESRPAARVRHPARSSLGAALGQLVIHGSGAAWCERRHPGSFPAPTARQLTRRLAHSLCVAAARALRGDGQGAGFALAEIPEALAFALGRLLPNRARWRPRPRDLARGRPPHRP